MQPYCRYPPALLDDMTLRHPSRNYETSPSSLEKSVLFAVSAGFLVIDVSLMIGMQSLSRALLSICSGMLDRMLGRAERLDYCPSCVGRCISETSLDCCWQTVTDLIPTWWRAMHDPEGRKDYFRFATTASGGASLEGAIPSSLQVVCESPKCDRSPRHWSSHARYVKVVVAADKWHVRK